MKYLLILLLLSSTIFAQRTSLEKVSLQLMWLDQFQFAGYYMAKEKGFYKDVGLDVKIRKFSSSFDTSPDVLTGKTDFAVGRSSLIKLATEGKEIVLLAAIYQSSPLVIIALKSSDIDTIKDFEGKTLMLTTDGVETASIHAMITSAQLDEKTLKYKKHNFNLEDLVDGTIDLYAGYISNEPFLLKQRGIEYKLFYPFNEGFNFYSDILFTSKNELQKHPKRVKKFTEASLKGWKYAFNHLDESVDIIYTKYNKQNKTKQALMFEAKELKKLAYQGTKQIGKIDPNKVKRIYDVYKLLGYVNAKLNIEDLVYKNSILTKQERAYLKKKKEISICVLPHSKPYSAIEDGKYVGVGAELLKLSQEKFDIEYKVEEDLHKCDLLPITSRNKEKEKYFRFTNPYHREPLVIVTKTNTNYIIDFETVLDKTFSVVEGNAFIEYLQNKYPTIKLETVDDIQEGLVGVENGKYYGHIDVLVGSAYAIKNIGADQLQISGQFEKKVDICLGVKKNEPILFDIFEKFSKSLRPSDLQKILNNWVRINYTNNVSYAYLKGILGFGILLFLLFLFKHYILNKKNEKLQVLQDEILEANKNLELRVQEAVCDLEKAQEVAHVGSWVLDVNTNDLRWSKETYKIFDLNVEDIENLFEAFLERIHPQDREKVVSTYENALQEKINYSIEHRLLMDDSSIKYVLETCQTSYDENLHPLVSHGTVQDITQRIEAKKELEKKDAMMLQQSRLAQMGEMLSMISHQWKQPLSSISASEIAIKTVLSLEKYDLSEKKEREDFLIYLNEKLDKIALYVQSLSQIITDFSHFYKPHRNVELVNIDMVIRKAYRLVEDMVRSTDIVVRFALGADTKIMMYENEFMQVVLNIINNAKEQFVEKKIRNPKITLRSYRIGDILCVEVQDNAGGIDEAIIDEIFDPYFSTKLDKNGTGLGLYMSKIILKDYHGGDIYVTNRKDGVLFTIKIDIIKNMQDKNEK